MFNIYNQLIEARYNIFFLDIKIVCTERMCEDKKAYKQRELNEYLLSSTYDRRSSERELDLRSKRTTSAQGLDRNTEGRHI